MKRRKTGISSLLIILMKATDSRKFSAKSAIRLNSKTVEWKNLPYKFVFWVFLELGPKTTNKDYVLQGGQGLLGKRALIFNLESMYSLEIRDLDYFTEKNRSGSQGAGTSIGNRWADRYHLSQGRKLRLQPIICNLSKFMCKQKDQLAFFLVNIPLEILENCYYLQIEL